MPDNKHFTIEQVKADPAHDYVLAHWNGSVPMYRRVMDESDMQQLAMEEWVSVLAQLWIAFGKAIDVEQMAIYQRSLSSLPMGLLDSGVQRVIREHRFNSVPTLHDVWDAVRKELGNPVDLDRAVHGWMENRWSELDRLQGSAVEFVAVETDVLA